MDFIPREEVPYYERLVRVRSVLERELTEPAAQVKDFEHTFGTSERMGFPYFYCYITSYALQKLLGLDVFYGDVTINSSEFGHAWCVDGSLGLIVDLTLSQFDSGLPSIAVIKNPHPTYNGRLQPNKEESDLSKVDLIIKKHKI